jgi:hypothetical protein
LMRYYSLAIQLMRYRASHKGTVQGFAEDGYVGVYARCGGLDASRFSGKSQSEEIWRGVFAYYFELWIADKVFAALADLCETGEIKEHEERLLVSEFMMLFDVPVGPFEHLRELKNYAEELRRELDYKVNNAAISRSLEVDIKVTRGKLFFGIPKGVISNVVGLENVIFVYLLDEFENFSADQQIYINTLIREREGPSAFKIGVRLYGVKTKNTLSGDERNLLGSEFEELRLDERFRKNLEGYKDFATRLVARRINNVFGDLVLEADSSQLKKYFEEPDLTWKSPYWLQLFPNEAGERRTHHRTFSEKLEVGIKEGLVLGLQSDKQIGDVILAVSFPEYPLIEKLCILYLYQQWFRSADLLTASVHVNESAIKYLEGARDGKFAEFVSKHSADMSAQLLRENQRKQIYSGFDSFVRMSEGLPRIYTQERPFQGGLISEKAQQRGVTEAASWFLEHMIDEGERGAGTGIAVDRLAQLFRTNRFADKPVETSLVAFSVDELALENPARDILSHARDTSLIVEVPAGQRERNSEQVTNKLELNTMLAPKWDLPISRRGVATFSPAEANCIFSPSRSDEFSAMLRSWTAKMTAPSFGRTKKKMTKRGIQADMFE